MVSRQSIEEQNVEEAEAKLSAFEESLRTLDGDLNLSLIQLDRIDLGQGDSKPETEVVFTADQYGFIKSEITTEEAKSDVDENESSRTSIVGFTRGSLIIEDDRDA